MPTMFLELFYTLRIQWYLRLSLVLIDLTLEKGEEADNKQISK